MADTSNVRILYPVDPDEMSLLPLTVATGTVLARGDLVESTSGAAVAVNAASDIDTFAGVSLDRSRTGDTVDIMVLARAIINISVASATYEIGQGLQYSSGANGTDWVLTGATTGEDAIAWSRQYKSSAVTTLDVIIDSYATANATAGGGLWETSANGS